jgi:hypothetical protein
MCKNPGVSQRVSEELNNIREQGRLLQIAAENMRELEQG